MAGFSVRNFKGIRPRISALKLPEGEAETATNVKLGSGDVEPWTDVDSGLAVSDEFFNKTIYLFDNDGDPKWFEWSNFVDVARGTVKGDSQERTYYTGDGVPKMTYRDIAVTGTGPYPSASRKLGIPAPTVAPTVTGSSLPEQLPSDQRRTVPGSMTTKLFEVVFANFTVYPGAGTPTDIWTQEAGADGDIVFSLTPGDSVKVLEVLDADTVKLGSATGTGAFAATAENDKTTTANWDPYEEAGSTQEADFTGWRIPDGVEVQITGHRLRVGDVIRVTRTDYSNGIIFASTGSLNLYEQSWAAPVQVTIDGSTFYQVPNGRVGANAAGTAAFAALAGGFYYDVDRLASTSDTLEDRSYVYTYVSSLGEEGPPSPVSATVDALDGDTMQINGIEPPPTFFYDITHVRIYRTAATSAGTEYQFVKEIAVATSTTENVFGADLGEVLGTTTWFAPPEGMEGITSMPNGMMVGFKGKNLYLCEPFFPHAWPPEYDQAVDYEIVGLAAFGNSIAVLTEGFPYLLTGSHPRNVNVRPYKINQACSSAKSIASTQDRVIYASPDGLVEISVNGIKVVTEGYVDKSDWATYTPDSLAGAFHDGKYFGFYDGPDNVSQPPATVFLTGTITTSPPDESDIQAGGKTIILTLASDTWVAAGATFNAQRQNIIDGFVASGDFITGWNNAMLTNIPVTDVVRTSNTIVTITLSARTEYSIVDSETPTVTVPATALTAGTALVPSSTFSITPLANYSSIAIGFTDFDSADDAEPWSITAHKDITDWDEYEGVAQNLNDETDITGATYSLALDRWVAVGHRDSGAPVNPSTPVIVSSDDDGVNWLDRAPFNAGVSGALLRDVVWFPDQNIFVAVGDNKVIEVSPNGIAWSAASIDAAIASGADINNVVVANGSSKPYMYASVLAANQLLRSPDLSLYPATNTWVASTLTYTTTTGTKLMASGNGVIVSIGANDTNMEVATTIHGALSGSAVGSIASYNCTGLVMGNDLWVAVSNNFRIITCDSGDEGTIGNWSSPSASKAANVTIHGITFDDGDGVIQGFGYIAYGVNTSSNKGVIYTSPDGATWTLRHTLTASVPVKAVAAKFPEAQLASVLLDFSPTLNGAQSPTLIGSSSAHYHTTPITITQANATASTDVTVEFITADAIINVVGVEGGIVDDQGSSSEASVDIFNLNVRPDSVRIQLIHDVYTDVVTDSTRTNSIATGGADPVSPPLSAFVDGQFFSPPLNFKYGYQADTRAVANASASENSAEAENTVGVSFTFRKVGYNDLTVEYRVYAKSDATTDAE